MAKAAKSFNELLRSEECLKNVSTRFTIVDEKSVLDKDAIGNILNLPDEMLIEILKFLPLYDKRNCTLVCKTLRRASFNSSLWRNVSLSWMKVKVITLERIFNCGVRNLKLLCCEITDQMTLSCPFFKSNRFEALSHLDIYQTRIKPNLLENVLALTPQLKYVRLFYACESISSGILQILLKLEFLESLEVVDNVRVLKIDHNILDVFKISRRYTNLKYVCFRLMTNIPDDAIDVFKKYFENLFKLSPNITLLELGKSITIDEETLRHIFNMLYMEKLSVATNLSVINNANGILGDHDILYKLHELKISAVSFTILPQFFERSPNLKSVYLKDCSLPRTVTGQLTSLEYLQDLTCKRCYFESFNETLGNLQSLKSPLRILCLRDCDGLNSNLSTMLLRCNSLETFEISNVIMNWDAFRNIMALKRLETLKMRKVKLQFPNERFIDSRNRTFIRLRSLHLEAVQISETEVVLSFCFNITNLVLLCCKISKHVIQCIVHMKNLERLIFRSVRQESVDNMNDSLDGVLCELTDFDFSYEEYQTAPSLLEFLFPAVNCAKQIYLENFTITKVIYRCILKMKKLHSVVLSSVSGVTSQCIPELLKNCPKLTKNRITM